MKVLSLFDGMACGMIAMQLAGVEVESYDAYEIDKYAIKAAQHNFPMIKEHGDVFDADFTQYEGVDFLIGGSPCTYWSIAQTKNRETVASGMGWELFSQYVRALHEAKPKYFIYENNKSMSKAIRASIDETFGFEAVLINSALVSAQNRQRLYWVGKRNDGGTYSKVPVEQPEDRGILLRDILETGIAWQEKSYCLAAGRGGHSLAHDIVKSKYTYAAEPVNITQAHGCAEVLNVNPCGHGMNGAVIHCDGKCRTLTTNKGEGPKIIEPIRIGTIENDAKNPTHDSQQYHVYSPDGKGVKLCGNGGGLGAKTGLYATPVRVGDMPSADGKICGSQSKRIYSIGGKAPSICATETGGNSDTSSPATRLYAVPCDPDIDFAEANYEIIDGAEILIANGKIRQGDSNGSKQGKYVYTELTEKANTISAGQAHNEKVLLQMPPAGNFKTVYEVKDGQITIKGKQYPIKLVDGYYIIRKLTVRECMRLQTVPEWYEFPVSDSQSYKMLGNGWTCEVIAHLIRSAIA